MRTTSRHVGYPGRATMAVAVVGAVLLALLSGRAVDAVAPSTQADDSAQLAENLVDRAGMRRGICVVLGTGDKLALEVARASQMLVHVRDPRADAVAALRAAADAAGLGIDRLAVEGGTLEKLPYADNMVDVILAPRAAGASNGKPSVEEMLRVLRPEGIAIAIGQEDPAGFKQSATRAGAARVETWQDPWGTFVQFSKPIPKGIDAWTHWEHGPDNNPVSSDAMIKAPYMTQFMSGPLYIPMPSITTAAGGRTFLAIGHIAHHRREWDLLNKLIARNGYNGAVLWQHDLPEGYLVHRSAFVASKDIFYMIGGDHCRMLDAETGQEKGQVRIPGLDGQWKWIVIDQGILYALAGPPDPGAEITKGDRDFGGWSWSDLSKGYYTKPRIPWGFGNTLAAYDIKNKKLLWKHSEEKPIDSRALSMGNGKLFLYCPDQHLRCLDAATGQIQWTSSDSRILELIEQPGRGLTSTPGFRTACLSVFTPDALIIQGQTRMNVVAVSTKDGYLLWSKKKITNNPNAIYVDGNVVLGVGPRGSHVVIDPVTGDEKENLGFTKTACTRLTASQDSFFVRGEGTLRFDRQSKQVLVDGAVRPACNDGALPANGLLYLGPWQCDCNLSLIGVLAKCSAGDFQFAPAANESEQLETYEPLRSFKPALRISAEDWPTFRANNDRSSGTPTDVLQAIALRWQYTPARPLVPTAPTAAGSLVYTSGSDGKVRALDTATGNVRWEFATPGQIKMPPTVWEGRAYVGSADGCVYALDAATGQLLWRFRASPVERHIMVYESISSTWPVHSGVLVHDGVAYFAAGIIDYDGTYVTALDATTGKLKWQNNSSGHLSEQLRKGVSAQGNLSIEDNQLLLAGGNQVSPAPFDLETGQCLAKPLDQGAPKANNGQFVGVFDGKYPIVGGRILFSAPENVSTKGTFTVVSGGRPLKLSYGGIPPAWHENTVALVSLKNGKLTCCDADKVSARIQQGYPQPSRGIDRLLPSLFDALKTDGAVRWQSDLDESNQFEAVALVVCPNAVVAAVQYQQQFRSQPQWFVVALKIEDGSLLWQQELQGQPLPGGLLVDRQGQTIVTMLDGSILCLGKGQ